MLNLNMVEVEKMVSEFINDSKLTHSVNRPLFIGTFTIAEMNIINDNACSYHGVTRTLWGHFKGMKGKRNVNGMINGSLFTGSKKDFDKLSLDSIISLNKEDAVRFGSKKTRKVEKVKKAIRIEKKEKRKNVMIANFNTSFDVPKIKREEKRISKRMNSFKTLLKY